MAHKWRYVGGQFANRAAVAGGEEVTPIIIDVAVGEFGGEVIRDEDNGGESSGKW